MSEKDVVTGIIVAPTHPSVKLMPNTISFRIPSERPQDIIDITRSVQVIIASDGHRGQYIKATETTIVGNTEADQKGIQRLSLQNVTNATPYTHDIAGQAVIKISVPKDWLQTQRDFYSDGDSAIAKEGEDVMVILPPVLQSTDPTQGRLALPTTVSTNESRTPQTPTTNTTSSSSYVGPMTNEQLAESKKAP